MRSVALLLVALLGCSHSVRADEPEPTETPWCFRLHATARNGTPVSADVCLSLRAACDEVRKAARRYGSYGGVESIGECRWEP